MDGQIFCRFFSLTLHTDNAFYHTNLLLPINTANMSKSFSTVDLPSPATVRHPSPPDFFPYRFDADSLSGASPAPHSCLTPTIPIGPYARVNPAMAVYVIACGSSFCAHRAWTPTRALGAPPLPSASEGTPQAARIAGWSFELDTLPFSESAFQAVDMLCYKGNCCIHDLLARTVAEMLACRDVTNVCDLAIPLVA